MGWAESPRPNQVCASKNSLTDGFLKPDRRSSQYARVVSCRVVSCRVHIFPSVPQDFVLASSQPELGFTVGMRRRQKNSGGFTLPIPIFLSPSEILRNAFKLISILLEYLIRVNVF